MQQTQKRITSNFRSFLVLNQKSETVINGLTQDTGASHETVLAYLVYLKMQLPNVRLQEVVVKMMDATGLELETGYSSIVEYGKPSTFRKLMSNLGFGVKHDPNLFMLICTMVSNDKLPQYYINKFKQIEKEKQNG